MKYTLNLFFLITFIFFSQPSFATETTATNNTPPETKEYTNPAANISFTIPDGFKITTKSDTMVVLVGPLVKGRLMSISVNYMPMPMGVTMDTMYQMNMDARKKNSDKFTAIADFAIENGKAFTMEETEKNNKVKEIHRRFLMLWGNNYFVNVGVSGNYDGIQEKKDLITQFFESFIVIKDIND